MSTYTDLKNVVKETVAVNYDDRYTNQKVRFLNEENEFWGTYHGTLAGDATLKGVGIENSTLTNVELSACPQIDAISSALSALKTGTKATTDYISAVVDASRSELEQKIDQIDTDYDKVRNYAQMISDLSSEVSVKIHALGQGIRTNADDIIAMGLAEKADYRTLSTFMTSKAGNLSAQVSAELLSANTRIDELFLSCQSNIDTVEDCVKLANAVDDRRAVGDYNLSIWVHEIQNYVETVLSNATELSNLDEVMNRLDEVTTVVDSAVSTVYDLSSEMAAYSAEIDGISSMAGGFDTRIDQCNSAIHVMNDTFLLFVTNMGSMISGLVKKVDDYTSGVVDEKAFLSDILTAEVEGDLTKTTLGLKPGLSVDVVTQHQDLSNKANLSDMAITDVAGLTDRKNIKLKDGLSCDVLTAHQDLSEKLGKVIEVTWEELRTLRDDDELVPGQQYRITDYVATTNGNMESRSANHQFDIIVTADSESKLNEKARAIDSNSTRYFWGQGCNLAAWQVWYCLDNDTNRFQWALADGETDPNIHTTGKGIVYRLIDEFGNDCPYDFKGIQFYAYGNEDMYRYTFDSGADSGNTDYSLSGFSRNVEVCHNVVKPCIISGKQRLNRIVIAGQDNYANTFGEGCEKITLSGGQCYKNTFGYDCSEHFLAEWCYENTFGDSCNSNYFKDSCRQNKFGDDCSGIRFESGCYGNIFAEDCGYNEFAQGCYDNVFCRGSSSNEFGQNCCYNTFGVECYQNKFGNDCFSNKFGDQCYRNKFGNGCDSNTFGSWCHNNQFGDSCYGILFQDLCNGNKFGYPYKDYNQYSTFNEGEYVYYPLDKKYYKLVSPYKGIFAKNKTYYAGDVVRYTNGEWNYYRFTANYTSTSTTLDKTKVVLIQFGNNDDPDNYFCVEENPILSYYGCITFETGTYNICLVCNATRGDDEYCQNIKVACGVYPSAGEDSKVITVPYASNDFLITYQPADSRVVSV